MTLLYIFLTLVVVYCLFQSIRFKVLKWGERKTAPSVGDLAAAAVSHRETAVEEAFLTRKGRHHLFKERAYDMVGVLAALALIFLWMQNTGLLDQILNWSESLPRAEPEGG